MSNAQFFIHFWRDCRDPSYAHHTTIRSLKDYRGSFYVTTPTIGGSKYNMDMNQWITQAEMKYSNRRKVTFGIIKDMFLLAVSWTKVGVMRSKKCVAPWTTIQLQQMKTVLLNEAIGCEWFLSQSRLAWRTLAGCSRSWGARRNIHPSPDGKQDKVRAVIGAEAAKCR